MGEEFDSLVRDVLGEQVDRQTESEEFSEKHARFYDDVRRHLLSIGTQELESLQRDSEQRFSTSMPLGRVHDTTIAIVGAGGLGNHIWKVLLGMGFIRLHVFDDDVVGVENIGPQMHRIIDIGLPKVEAVRREALAFRGIEIGAHNMRVNSMSDIVDKIGEMPDVLIGATDSAEFRNAIIGELNDAQFRTLDLFLDFRMALGDWNCFAFTPAALAAWNNFGARQGSMYDRYRKLAVFDPSEAVHEPCTARAITYTGANVASYAGAFLHWWVSYGKDKCYGDRDFLLSTYYSPNKSGSDFNWLYRNSSKEFVPETMTVGQARFVEDAAKSGAASSALGAMLEREWGETTARVPRETQTEAYIDMNGVSHLYQTYNVTRAAGSLYVVAGLDLNIETGKMRAAAVLNDNGAFEASREVLAAKLSPCRAHTEILKSVSSASSLMRIGERGGAAARFMLCIAAGDKTSDDWMHSLAVDACSDVPGPMLNAMYSGDGTLAGGKIVFLLISNPVYSESDGTFTFDCEAWKIAPSLSRIPLAVLPGELRGMAGRKHGSGWIWTNRPESIASSLIPPASTSPVDNEVGAALRSAVVSILNGEGTVAVSDVADGRSVEVAAMPGARYVKGTGGSLPWLSDGERKIYVSPSLQVRVAGA